MNLQYNKDIFDESKIIRKEINNSNDLEKTKNKNIENDIVLNKEELEIKSKKYLDIIEEEKKKEKNINTKVSRKKNKIDKDLQLLIIQESQQMLEITKKNIIKTKIEIEIHLEIFRSEYILEDKKLYESKLKIFNKEIKYLEKRKNILENIISKEMSKK